MIGGYLLSSSGGSFEDFFEGVGVLRAVGDVLIGCYAIEDEVFGAGIIRAEYFEVAVLGCSAVLSEDDTIEGETLAARAGETNLKHNGKEKSIRKSKDK